MSRANLCLKLVTNIDSITVMFKDSLQTKKAKLQAINKLGFLMGETIFTGY